MKKKAARILGIIAEALNLARDDGLISQDDVKRLNIDINHTIRLKTFKEKRELIKPMSDRYPKCKVKLEDVV